MQKRRVSL